jgi:hypothetical protein
MPAGTLFGQPGCECCVEGTGNCQVCAVDCNGVAITQGTVTVLGPNPATTVVGVFTLDGTNCFKVDLVIGSAYTFLVDVPGFATQTLVATAAGSPCSITLRPDVGVSHWDVSFCCGPDPCGTGASVGIDVGGARITFTSTRTGLAYSCTVPAGASGCGLTVPAFDDYVVSVTGWPAAYFAPADVTVHGLCCAAGDARCRLWRQVERRQSTLCADVTICACDDETGIAVGQPGGWSVGVTVCGVTATATPTSVSPGSSPGTMAVRWCATVVKSAPGSCGPAYAAAVWTVAPPAPWVGGTFTPAGCRPDLCSASIACGLGVLIDVDAYHACCGGVACKSLTVSSPLGTGSANLPDCAACVWYGWVDFEANCITHTACTYNNANGAWDCVETVGTALVRVWLRLDFAAGVGLVVSGGLKRRCQDPGTCGGGPPTGPCLSDYRWVAYDATVTITNAAGAVTTVPYFTDPPGPCGAPGLYTTACGTCPAAFWQSWSGPPTRPCPWDGAHAVTATLPRPVPDPGCPTLVPPGPDGVWGFTPTCAS